MPDTLLRSEQRTLAWSEQRDRAAARKAGLIALITGRPGEVPDPPEHWKEFTGQPVAKKGMGRTGGSVGVESERGQGSTSRLEMITAASGVPGGSA